MAIGRGVKDDDDFGGMAWREYLMFKTFWLSNILKNESEEPEAQNEVQKEKTTASNYNNWWLCDTRDYENKSD